MVSCRFCGNCLLVCFLFYIFCCVGYRFCVLFICWNCCCSCRWFLCLGCGLWIVYLLGFWCNLFLCLLGIVGLVGWLVGLFCWFVLLGYFWYGFCWIWICIGSLNSCFFWCIYVGLGWGCFFFGLGIWFWWLLIWWSLVGVLVIGNWVW